MPHSFVDALKAARTRRAALAVPGHGRKAIEYGPPQRARANYGRPINSLWSTDQAIERDFKQSVLVYRAVMGLASALGSVRWVAEVKAASGGGAWEADESHPLQGLLNQPHAYFARQDFNEVLAMWLALAGNALFLKTTATGKPEPGATRPRLLELIPLSPEGIEPVPDPNAWLKGYEFRKGSVHLKWKAEEILHFMVRDPSNLYWGLSPLKAAAGVVRMDIAAVGWNTHSLNNRAIPSGILTTKEKLTQPQYDEVSDQLYDQHTGPSAAGLPMLVSGGFEWQAQERSPQEMDFIQTRMRNREDILSALGMPPVMAGFFENATLANAEVSRRMFWEDNLIPTYAERVAGGLNAGVVPHFGDPARLRVGYDISGIPALREDLQKKASILRTLTANGTPYNQALEELEMDLPPIEGAGDVPYGLEQYRVKRQPPVETPPEDVPSKTPTADAARPPANEQERDGKRAKGLPEFNPDQPRDEEGEWSDSGGGLSDSDKQRVKLWQTRPELVADFRAMSAGQMEPSQEFKEFEQALEKLPQYDGTVYRGMANVDLSAFQEGTVIEYASLASTSKNRDYASWFAARGFDRETRSQYRSDPERSVLLRFEGGGDVTRSDLGPAIDDIYLAAQKEVVIGRGFWTVTRVRKTEKLRLLDGSTVTGITEVTLEYTAPP